MVYRYVRWLAAVIAIACVTATRTHAQSREHALAELPVIEVPAAGGETLAIFWSGDGGWASLVSSVSKELSANGAQGCDARIGRYPKSYPYCV